MGDPLLNDIEAEVERLGFELVEMERAGSATRPIIRLKIDRPGSESGQGVTLDDCAMLSRALEASLDNRSGFSERYVLEVSSPGVERPLVRRRDFDRFAGREIAVVGKEPLHGGTTKRLAGELIGLEGPDGEERIRLRLASGEILEIPRERTKRVHLVYRWGDEGR